ncbi:MAG: hypothetical protein OQK77_05580 [Psychromonas sp.]|nr:hypothetical protein [Psychromonas sp.]
MKRYTKQKRLVTLTALSALLTLPAIVHAELTGNISVGNETELTRFDDANLTDRGSSKWELSAFLQDQYQHPGWFGGFYMAQEDGFTGPLENQVYTSENSIMETYLGKLTDTSWGNWGLEVMIGHESAPDAYKVRPKITAWSPITNRMSIKGYAMYVMQDTRLAQDQQEEQLMTELETEPEISYQLTDSFGTFFRVYWRDRTQKISGKSEDRNPNASSDRSEQEFALKPGISMNLGKLKTTLWGEFGNWKLEDKQQVLREYDYKAIAGTAEYPIADSLMLTSEFRYLSQENKEGPWDASDAYMPKFKIGVRYLF